MTLSSWIYSPWLAAVRTPALVTAVALGALGIAGALYQFRAAPSVARFTLVTVALIGPTLLAHVSFKREMQHSVTMKASRVRDVGRHIIVGYHSPSDVEPLIARGAVGGVFVTARNARGKSIDQLAAEIARLQTVALSGGHPPLIVTTDQEGGFVSRLSPPLERPPLLATLVRGAITSAERRRKARDEGERVGRDLSRVGITLNLAPLADLDFGIRNPADRMSRIGERAIATDAIIVAEVARAYCEGMASAGVACTLKHFPGLGRVADDTHVTSARLDTAHADLAAKDWLPYRAPMRSKHAAVMVGHVVATAIDPLVPASLSRRVVTEALRGELGHTGLVITDDLCMAAITDHPGGIAAGAAAALAAGGDLVLVSYDPEQVYATLSGLLRFVDDATLASSRARLDAFLAGAKK